MLTKESQSSSAKPIKFIWTWQESIFPVSFPSFSLGTLTELPQKSPLNMSFHAFLPLFILAAKPFLASLAYQIPTIIHGPAGFFKFHLLLRQNYYLRLSQFFKHTFVKYILHYLFACLTTLQHRVEGPNSIHQSLAGYLTHINAQ